MRQASFDKSSLVEVSVASQRNGLRIRLTDLLAIATEVGALQAAGYNELAIWRHFLDAFIVDLDALSLIIAELFGAASEENTAHAAASAQFVVHREAA
jgi:hypothetical protein